MNVPHAKNCFAWNTLAVIADYLYCALGVISHEGRLKVKDSQNENKVGFMIEVAEELNGILKQQVECGTLSEESAKDIGHDVSSFEWLAHVVHEIFINRLMNIPTIF